MKNKNGYFYWFPLFAALTSAVYAQTTGQDYSQTSSQNELPAVQLKTVLKPMALSMWDSGNGFVCKYVVDNVYYIIRFDKAGRYVETLKKKVWNDQIPNSLLVAFLRSDYKSQKVMVYWEVIDPDRIGYYIEMKDSRNRASCVWVDGHGKFSIIPLTDTN
jgi:hypothetical protein